MMIMVNVYLALLYLAVLLCIARAFRGINVLFIVHNNNGMNFFLLLVSFKGRIVTQIFSSFRNITRALNT